MDDGCRFCRFLWGSFHDWRYDLDRAILDSEENAHLWIGRYQDRVFGDAADSINIYCGQEYPRENVRRWLELELKTVCIMRRFFKG
jgi:hypothetical protein